jgi:hypothetical protein
VKSVEHQGLAFNLLDTPGHQDFSEGCDGKQRELGEAEPLYECAADGLQL